jgi:membrane fusion protein
MKQLFRQEVIDKRTQRLSGVVSLVQPPIFKWLTILIVLVVIVSLVFLSLGNYTRKESVSGVLQPNTGIMRLSAPQNGVITELLVEEGQVVKKNQPLLRIMSEKHGVKGFELNQALINQYQFQIKNLKQQLIDQVTQQQFETTALKDEQASLSKRLFQLDQQSGTFAKRIQINEKIVKQVSSLAGTGFISDLELMRQRDSLLALQQQKSAMKSERLLTNNQLQQNSSRLSQLPIEQEKARNALTTQLSQVNSQLSTIEQQRLGELRAPMDGKVTGLLAKLGKSVNSQQNLLSILPEASFMQAIIYVPTSAFGFIAQGQLTQLRFHAFPYQRFGIHEGQVEQISSSVILPTETDIPGLITVPSYRVVVSLNAQNIIAYGREHPLRSGMKLDADIVIEQRSLLRWLFDPVFSIQGRI